MDFFDELDEERKILTKKHALEYKIIKSEMLKEERERLLRIENYKRDKIIEKVSGSVSKAYAKTLGLKSLMKEKTTLLNEGEVKRLQLNQSINSLSLQNSELHKEISDAKHSNLLQEAEMKNMDKMLIAALLERKLAPLTPRDAETGEKLTLNENPAESPKRRSNDHHDRKFFSTYPKIFNGHHDEDFFASLTVNTSFSPINSCSSPVSLGSTSSLASPLNGKFTPVRIRHPRIPILHYQEHFIGNTKARLLLKDIYSQVGLNMKDFKNIGLEKHNKVKQLGKSKFELELEGDMPGFVQQVRNDHLEELLVILQRERIAEFERQALVLSESNTLVRERLETSFERDRILVRDRINRIKLDNEMGLAALLAKKGFVR